ncbi:MAG: hypothetical protein ACM65L_23890 [Microcoleus sp.]
MKPDFGTSPRIYSDRWRSTIESIPSTLHIQSQKLKLFESKAFIASGLLKISRSEYLYNLHQGQEIPEWT